MISATTLGFRIVGSCRHARKLVEYDAAFAAYCNCDSRIRMEDEAYLSPVQYNDEIRARIVNADQSLNVVGYSGTCWSRYVWFDIDREGDLAQATTDARRLTAYSVQRYQLDESDLLIFFSGSKGYHVGVPTSICGAEPSVLFPRVGRVFACKLAEDVGITVDASIYSAVQPLRAPNSRHPKTGLHKRWIAYDELIGMMPDAIRRLAEEPYEFDPPNSPGLVELAVDDWRAACDAAIVFAASRPRAGNVRTELNRLTLEFIREGAENGERQRRLYSAAANLAEFDFSAAQAAVVLRPAAMESGLSPSEIDRTISCGINRSEAK